MRFLTTLFAALLLASPAIAHTGLGLQTSFLFGFLHPISGLDHVLAMLLVGLLAVVLGGKAVWRLPMTFVGMMAMGGFLGLAGIAMPYVETGIALSVVMFGGLVTYGRRVPAAAALAVVGAFAVFHGQAHGAEISEAEAVLPYVSGFLAATGMLHGIGIAAGFAGFRLSTTYCITATRFCGAASCLAGVAMLAGAY